MRAFFEAYERSVCELRKYLAETGVRGSSRGLAVSTEVDDGKWIKIRGRSAILKKGKTRRYLAKVLSRQYLAKRHSGKHASLTRGTHNTFRALRTRKTQPSKPNPSAEKFRDGTGRVPSLISSAKSRTWARQSGASILSVLLQTAL